jgi:hypothetical protein
MMDWVKTLFLNDKRKNQQMRKRYLIKIETWIEVTRINMRKVGHLGRRRTRLVMLKA